MMPTVTKNLIIINVLVFFGTLVAQRYGIDLANYLGLHFFLASDFNPAQLITYMFMHGGFSHIFFNMFAVFMFGPILEQTWGPKRFLFYYILCGIGAGLIQEGVQYIQYITELSQHTEVNLIGYGIISMDQVLQEPFTPFCWHSECCIPTTNCLSSRCLSLSRLNSSLSDMLRLSYGQD